MSTIIHALNRLQSLQEQDLPIMANLSEPVTPTISQVSSSPVTNSPVVQKKPSAKKSVEKERPLFNMAPSDWLGILQHDYLKNFVREG